MDSFAFALLIGIPLFAISWVATKELIYVLGWSWGVAVGLALIIAWPVYYVAMTLREPGFLPGLVLLLFTSPAMLAGFALAMPRRAPR